MSRIAEDGYVLCTVLALLVSGLALSFWSTAPSFGIAVLGFFAAVSLVWFLHDYTRIRGARELSRSICSVDCTEEAYASLIQILDKEKIDYTVRDHYIVVLISPICGTIELKKTLQDSYSDTHVDDPGTTSEFYWDLHETKYDVFHNERPVGTIIRARPRTRKDSQGIENIVSAVFESLNLTAD